MGFEAVCGTELGGGDEGLGTFAGSDGWKGVDFASKPPLSKSNSELLFASDVPFLMTMYVRSFFRFFFVAALLVLSRPAWTQQTAAAALPDSPGAQAEGSAWSSSSSRDAGDAQARTGSGDPGTPAQNEGQTKRILGIIPNFRAVSADAHLPPQTVKEKFTTATQDTFDYSGLFLPAVLAGYSQATNATPEFHQGAAGYGRYFWHSYVDQAVENYMVEFIVPAATREDTRYYTLGKGGFMKRAGYSLSRVVITRSDKGTPTFNAGEVIGAGAAAGISNFYYPSPERTLGNTVSKWGTNVGVDAGTFMFKEFWPNINRALFGGKN